MLPSFSAASMRPLVPLFFEKAQELSEKLTELAAAAAGGVGAAGDEKGGAGEAEGEVDVMLWIGRSVYYSHLRSGRTC